MLLGCFRNAKNNTKARRTSFPLNTVSIAKFKSLTHSLMNAIGYRVTKFFLRYPHTLIKNPIKTGRPPAKGGVLPGRNAFGRAGQSHLSSVGDLLSMKA